MLIQKIFNEGGFYMYGEWMENIPISNKDSKGNKK